MTLRKIINGWGQHDANFGPFNYILEKSIVKEYIIGNPLYGNSNGVDLKYYEEFGECTVRLRAAKTLLVRFFSEDTLGFLVDRNTGDVYISPTNGGFPISWVKIPADCMLEEEDFQLLPLLYPGAGNTWDMIKCLLQKYYWCRMPDE